MEFEVGIAGWAAFRSDSTGPYTYARFSKRETRLVITRLHLVDDDGIGTDCLRRLPLGRVEALANGPYRSSIEDGLNDDPEPEPERNVFTSVEEVTRLVASQSVEDHFDDLLGNPERPDYKDRVETVEKYRELVTKTKRELDAFLASPSGRKWRKSFTKVTVPKARPYPTPFYAQVADIYGALAAIGSRQPAVEIANDNKVPASTVHRWIKEARRLKLLPEGQRGKRI